MIAFQHHERTEVRVTGLTFSPDSTVLAVTYRDFQHEFRATDGEFISVVVIEHPVTANCRWRSAPTLELLIPTGIGGLEAVSVATEAQARTIPVRGEWAHDNVFLNSDCTRGLRGLAGEACPGVEFFRLLPDGIEVEYRRWMSETDNHYRSRLLHLFDDDRVLFVHNPWPMDGRTHLDISTPKFVYPRINEGCYIPSEGVGEIAVSPVSDEVCVLNQPGSTLFVCSVANLGEEPQRVRHPKQKHFTSLAYHCSGRYLATTANDSRVLFYDTANWKVAKTFDWKIGKLRCVAFSPDGALAAVGSDKGQVVVWDVDV